MNRDNLIAARRIRIKELYRLDNLLSSNGWVEVEEVEVEEVEVILNEMADLDKEIEKIDEQLKEHDKMLVNVGDILLWSIVLIIIVLIDW